MMYLEILRKIRMSLGLPLTHTEPVALVDLELRGKQFGFMNYHVYIILHLIKIDHRP